MATATLNTVVRHLRSQERADLSDGDLLNAYAGRHEESAFEALLRRHGPMVLGVCRRILGDSADAEDAFQATFLVFIRKAGTIRSGGMVANWLYGVAHNTALKARAMNLKRRTREKEAVAAMRKSEVSAEARRQIQSLVDEELSRLPDKYRAVIVLCDVEGRTIREAGRHLGWPQGTVATRLTRARKILAKRLAGHGFAVLGSVLTGMLSQDVAAAFVPTPLVTSTLKVATLFAAGKTTASSTVTALAEGVLRTMLLQKLKCVVTFLVTAILFTAAGTEVWRQTVSARAAAPLREAVDVKPQVLIERALEAAAQINDERERVAVLVQIGKAQAKAGHRIAARKILQEAAKIALHHVASDPSGMLSAVAEAQAFAGDIKGAIATTASLTQRYRLSALARVTVAHARAGNIQEALAMAKNIGAEGDENAIGAFREIGKKERGYALMSIVAVQAGAGDVEGALNTVAIVEHDTSRVGALLAIAQAQIKKKDKVAAEKYLQRALLEVPNVSKPVIGEQISKKERIALSSWRERCDALAEIASTQAELGDTAGALKIAKSLPGDEEPLMRNRFRSLALQRVAEAQLEAGDFTGAKKTAAEAPDTVWQEFFVHKLALALAHRGNHRAAKEVARGLRQDYFKIEFAVEIGRSLWKAGERDEASRTIREALQQAEMVKDPPNTTSFRPHIIRQIAAAKAETGQEQQVVDWIARQASAYTRALAYLGVVEGLEQRKQSFKTPKD